MAGVDGGGESVDTAVVELMVRQQALINDIAAEMARLGKGIERIAAKYGADHPEPAAALHRLLRDR